jgi:4-hydroxybenzoate polyprenyltransferase
MAQALSGARIQPSTLLRTMRPRDWAHFVVLPAAGVDSAVLHNLPGAATRLVAGAFVTATALAYAYGLNGVTDRFVDRDPRKNPFTGVGAVPPLTMLFLYATAGAALCVAALLGTTSVALASASIAASTVYSAGPRLKARVGIGTLLNLIIFAPLLAVACPLGRLPDQFFLLGIAFVTLLLQNQLLHERADAAEDAGASLRTTGLLLADRGVAVVITVLGVSSAFVCSVMAPAWHHGPLAALLLVAVTGSTLALPLDARVKRLVHRWLSLLAGSAIYGASWFWG